MQKLRERNTYTPTDIPHVRGNCDLQLTSSEGIPFVNENFDSQNFLLTA